MSCWVVPTIAAEIWGVPLQQVLDAMQNGEIASKLEAGFTFVDVAPDSPVFEKPQKQTPPTYTVVSHQELVALGAEDEQHSMSPEEWQISRDAAERRRRPPMAA
jgi:hypothetical protein